MLEREVEKKSIIVQDDQFEHIVILDLSFHLHISFWNVFKECVDFMFITID